MEAAPVAKYFRSHRRDYLSRFGVFREIQSRLGRLNSRNMQMVCFQGVMGFPMGE